MAQHNPYVGPRPFTEEEERFFFGRAEEIEILTSLVIARRASLLFAQSGAGKSSLLMAGLTPRLLRYARTVRYKEVVQPLVSGIRIARVGKGIEDQQPLNVFIQSVALSLAKSPTTTVARDVTLDTILSAVMPSPDAGTDDATGAATNADSNADNDGASLPFLLVFDQFEELFTRHLALRSHREDFFTQVRTALHQRDDLRVLFSMREDYLAELTSFAHLLPDQLRPRFRLERLKFETAVEAVRRPAESATTPHPFANEVAEELCRNLQSSNSDDIEPILLQVACKRLWQNLPDDRSEIESDDLKNFGDVDSALEGYYNDAIAMVVSELTAAGQPISERRVRRFFSQQLLTPSRTRALVFRDDAGGFTAGLPNAAIEVLSRSDINILRGETRAGSHWYELSHDRLIQPVLEANTRWEEANITPLQKRAQEWNSRGRQDRDLLTRLELHEIDEQIRSTPDDTLTPLEEEFYTRSRQTLASASVRLRMNIEDLGWAILFAGEDTERDAIRLALAPLLDHRRKHTQARFSQFEFIVKPNETAQQFLARSGALATGGSDSQRMPFYLMIVGSPERIPFEFQYALDAHYAVGRLHFEGETREETLLMYARYARSVVEAESGHWGLPRQSVVFGPLHEYDRPTQLLMAQLITPLIDELSRPELLMGDWAVAPVIKELATYDKLLRLLGGDSRPALLFTAAHGVARALQDEAKQRREQGAIVCAEWQMGKALTPGTYVAARDIADAANPLGMIIFMVGEFGAGTPTYSNFPSQQRSQLTARPFISALCQRLLSHPNGGALAIIAHVDTSWMMTFDQFMPGKSKTGERQWKSEGNTTFLNTVSRLVRGHTVGSAMEFFNTRYMQAAADLVDTLLNASALTKPQTDALMLEAIDVRNYIVLGDPAVRLPIDGPVPAQRPSIQVDRSVVDEIDAALRRTIEVSLPSGVVAMKASLERTVSEVEAPPKPASAAAPAAAVTPPSTPAVPVATPMGRAASADQPVEPLAVFNGIGLDGNYAYPPLSIEDLARLATARPGDSQVDVDATYKSKGTSYFESSAGAES